MDTQISTKIVHLSVAIRSVLSNGSCPTINTGRTVTVSPLLLPFRLTPPPIPCTLHPTRIPPPPGMATMAFLRPSSTADILSGSSCVIGFVMQQECLCISLFVYRVFIVVVVGGVVSFPIKSKICFFSLTYMHLIHSFCFVFGVERFQRLFSFSYLPESDARSVGTGLW